jgi:hypothetical protein
MLRYLHRRSWGWILGVGIVGAGIVAAHAAPAGGDAPSRLTKGGRLALRDVTGVSDHIMTSGRDMVFLTRDEEDRLQGGRLDVESGRKVLFPPLDRQPEVRYRFTSLSPDGNWLLSVDRSAHPEWVVRELRRSRRFHWRLKESTDGPTAEWMRDSRHWVEVTLSEPES